MKIKVFKEMIAQIFMKVQNFQTMPLEEILQTYKAVDCKLGSKDRLIRIGLLKEIFFNQAFWICKEFDDLQETQK